MCVSVCKRVSCFLLSVRKCVSCFFVNIQTSGMVRSSSVEFEQKGVTMRVSQNIDQLLYISSQIDKETQLGPKFHWNGASGYYWTKLGHDVSIAYIQPFMWPKMPVWASDSACAHVHVARVLFYQQVRVVARFANSTLFVQTLCSCFFVLVHCAWLFTLACFRFESCLT